MDGETGFNLADDLLFVAVTSFRGRSGHKTRTNCEAAG
jgi:hypothetical protein